MLVVTTKVFSARVSQHCWNVASEHTNRKSHPLQASLAQTEEIRTRRDVGEIDISSQDHNVVFEFSHGTPAEKLSATRIEQRYIVRPRYVCRTASMEQIANLGGYGENYRAGNLQYGVLCGRIAGQLGAYVLGFITGIVFLVLEPYKHDRFVRFHAMQSILYSAAGLVFRIAWSILVNILMSFTVWTGVVLVPIGLLISLGLFVFWLYLMY